MFPRALALALSLCGCNLTQAASSNYALATAHPLATEVGAQVLEAGGNAFDAAIAVSASLSVVEPYGSGLGGGGFFLLHDIKRNHTTFLDARERAPYAAHRDMYLDTEGAVNRNAALNGPLAAGIPGLAAAWAHLVEHYATLPLEQSLSGALKQARDGIAIDARLAAFLTRKREVLKRYPSSEMFLATDTLVQSDLADTLEHLMQHGAQSFYSGVLAETLVDGVRASGGIWSRKDLEDYRVVERDPITVDWRGARIVSAPLPSASGIMLAQIFQMLGEDWGRHSNGIADTHRMIEVLRRVYLSRARYLGDTDHYDVPVGHLTSPEYAKELMRDFDPESASHTLSATARAPKDGHTTHFSILDAQGNWVSATLSINGLFGSSFVAPKTGVLLNNEMDDFSAKPGSLNLYGLIGSEANAIAPGKRMLSSMAPSAVFANGRTALLGSPGGSRITTTVLGGILHFVAGADAQTMVSAPRLHFQAVPNIVYAEDEALPDTASLVSLGHTVETGGSWSNMQAVIREADGQVHAASDPRGAGAAHTGTLQH